MFDFNVTSIKRDIYYIHRHLTFHIRLMGDERRVWGMVQLFLASDVFDCRQATGPSIILIPNAVRRAPRRQEEGQVKSWAPRLRSRDGSCQLDL